MHWIGCITIIRCAYRVHLLCHCKKLIFFHHDNMYMYYELVCHGTPFKGFVFPTRIFRTGFVTDYPCDVWCLDDCTPYFGQIMANLFVISQSVSSIQWRTFLWSCKYIDSNYIDTYYHQVVLFLFASLQQILKLIQELCTFISHRRGPYSFYVISV